MSCRARARGGGCCSRRGSAHRARHGRPPRPGGRSGPRYERVAKMLINMQAGTHHLAEKLMDMPGGEGGPALTPGAIDENVAEVPTPPRSSPPGPSGGEWGGAAVRVPPRIGTRREDANTRGVHACRSLGGGCRGFADGGLNGWGVGYGARVPLVFLQVLQLCEQKLVKAVGNISNADLARLQGKGEVRGSRGGRGAGPRAGARGASGRRGDGGWRRVTWSSSRCAPSVV